MPQPYLIRVSFPHMLSKLCLMWLCFCDLCLVGAASAHSRPAIHPDCSSIFFCGGWENRDFGWAVCSSKHAPLYAPLVVLFLRGIAFLAASCGSSFLTVLWGVSVTGVLGLRALVLGRLGSDRVRFAKVGIVRLCQGTGECLLAAFPVAVTC